MIGMEGTTAGEIETGIRDLISNCEQQSWRSSIRHQSDFRFCSSDLYAIYKKDMAFNKAITDEGEEVS